MEGLPPTTLDCNWWGKEGRTEEQKGRDEWKEGRKDRNGEMSGSKDERKGERSPFNDPGLSFLPFFFPSAHPFLSTSPPPPHPTPHPHQSQSKIVRLPPFLPSTYPFRMRGRKEGRKKGGEGGREEGRKDLFRFLDNNYDKWAKMVQREDASNEGRKKERVAVTMWESNLGEGGGGKAAA
jgi:hypothetical protein